MNGRTSPTGLLLALGAAMELAFLALYAAPAGAAGVLWMIGVNVVAYALFALAVRLLRRAELPPGGGALVVLLFGVLFRLSLVPHGVIGSDDIYRYLWDGRVAASGINPYAYTPTDPHLAALATDNLPSSVNHPELKSVYPALAQGFFLLAHTLFGESVAAMKALLVLADCLTLLVLWRFVRTQRAPAAALLLYAWSPLPVLYFGLDGHIDALGILCVVCALAFFTREKPFRGAAALGAGALAKLVPLIMLPLLVRNLKGARRFIVPAIPVLMVIAGALIYYEPSWGVVQSLSTFSSRWEFNGSVFSVFYFLTGSNEAAHIVSGGLALVALGAIAALDRPLVEKVFWSFAAFVLVSPVVHPWYLTWLAALLPLRWSPGVFVFLGTSAAANVVVYQYRAFGEWRDQPLLLAVEYIPVFLLLAREIRRGEILPAAIAPGGIPREGSA
ncbi:MAG TPA: glycosyltransferase 87 family protein [Bacteroidota bacterium]|nr:glycosyltransferase 87 family protein [Bacteroidota bacterium]